jgi:hypothetical protein
MLPSPAEILEAWMFTGNVVETPFRQYTVVAAAVVFADIMNPERMATTTMPAVPSNDFISTPLL